MPRLRLARRARENVRAARRGARCRPRADRADRDPRRTRRTDARGRDRPRRPGSWGWCAAADWSSPLNERLGLVADGVLLRWALDVDRGVGRDERGREVDSRRSSASSACLRPSPASTRRLRHAPAGGNIDCKELVAGTTLYLADPGRRRALLGRRLPCAPGRRRGRRSSRSSVRSSARELTLTSATSPSCDCRSRGRRQAWLTFGFDEDLDEAAALALDGMLELMGREHGLERADALALASVVVDLRVTQVVNGVQGVHAVLRARRDSIHFLRWRSRSSCPISARA